MAAAFVRRHLHAPESSQDTRVLLAAFQKVATDRRECAENKLQIQAGGAFGLRGQAKLFAERTVSRVVQISDPALAHVNIGPPGRKRRRRSALPAHSISFACRTASWLFGKSDQTARQRTKEL